ncbi:MAG: hypothetical protein IJJ03_04170 [Mogibacterium sp.]|nr:hypothetical protein [Mogibacterium sp.]MBQ6500278.1 hypothetical protein [Mogibacterium sp.]
MILTLVYTPQIVEFLRVSPDSGAFACCVDYLRGTVIGLPAITAMSILTRGVHIEGKRDIVLLSVAVMVVANMLSDLMGLYVLHFDVFGITLDTSFSYYAGTAVLVYYYFRRDTLVKPVFKGASFGEMISVNRIGTGGRDHKRMVQPDAHDQSRTHQYRDRRVQRRNYRPAGI